MQRVIVSRGRGRASGRGKIESGSVHVFSFSLFFGSAGTTT